MKDNKGLLPTLVLASVICSGQANAQDYSKTGAQKIDDLIASIDAIQDRLTSGQVLAVGAVGYASIGGVVSDDAMNDGIITSAELGAYLAAKEAVLTHDYAIATTAEQMFMQEHAAAMNNLSTAVDDLAAATSVLMLATSVTEAAAEADTKPEQVALQAMLETDEYSIDAQEVDAYNDSVAAVENYAQQAGAFMAAANNTELTASIDSYATQGNFMIGNYTSITYTQSVDEFVITWADDGFNSGWQGYLSTEMQTADDLYGAGDYINLYGSMPSNSAVN